MGRVAYWIGSPPYQLLFSGVLNYGFWKIGFTVTIQSIKK
jgi:hypothetical protein